MELSDALREVYDTSIPKGTMMIRIDRDTPCIELYGQNQAGLSIPLDKLGQFINELQAKCKNPNETYTPFKALNFSLPGSKIEQVIKYLIDARDHPKSQTWKETF